MAYLPPTILRNDPTTGGRRHLQLQFTGNAGEPDVIDEFNVVSKADAKGQVIARLAQLNAAAAAAPAADPAMAAGQAIDTTPDAAPGVPPDDQWVADAQRLTRAKAVIDAITAAGLTPLTTMTNQYSILAGNVRDGYNAARGLRL